MSNKNILEQILSNTEEVKEVVVTRENVKQKKLDVKNEKRREQLRESQKKFMHVKASVKPDLYEKIKNRSEDGNVSKYILKLIDNDFNKTQSLFETFSEPPGKSSQEIEEITMLREKIKKLNSMSFAQKLRWLFL